MKFKFLTRNANANKPLENELVNDKNDKNVFVSHSVNDIDDMNDNNVFVNQFEYLHFVNDFANEFVNNFVNKPPKPLGDEIAPNMNTNTKARLCQTDKLPLVITPVKMVVTVVFSSHVRVLD